MSDTLQTIHNQKGKGTLTPTEVLESRTRLIKDFGWKIIGQPDHSWTDEEVAANALFKGMTQELYRVAPGMRTSDMLWQLYGRNGVDNIFQLLWKYALKFFWILFIILIFLALVKFVFH